MRKLLGILAATALAFGVAGSASAIVLNATGAAGIQVATLDPVLLPGALTVTVNNSGPGPHINTLTVPGSPFNVTGFNLPVTDPGAAPISGLLATIHNATGVFGGGSVAGGLAGQMALAGIVKVCLFASCSAPIVPANLNVPVSVVGQGGAAFVASSVNITVIGAPWTSATANVGSITAQGFAHGPASITSSTAAPSGVVSLVTPIFISTSIPSSAVVPGFGLLNIHIIPEPGTLLLLGSGVVGMALIGRRKLRK